MRTETSKGDASCVSHRDESRTAIQENPTWSVNGSFVTCLISIMHSLNRQNDHDSGTDYVGLLYTLNLYVGNAS